MSASVGAEDGDQLGTAVQGLLSRYRAFGVQLGTLARPAIKGFFQRHVRVPIGQLHQHVKRCCVHDSFYPLN